MRRGHSPSVADDDTFCVESDREVVRHGKLNDKIIDAANMMVAEHLGTPMQTTLIVQSSAGFAPCDIDRPMVAILHGIEHWVTVALRDGDVHYVDSLRPHQPLSTYVIRQLLQLFHDKVDDDGKLRVSIVPRTPQHSGDDCRVYAALYATELVLNNVPGLQAPFHPQQMCAHLQQCLEFRKLEQFPARRHATSRMTTQDHPTRRRHVWCGSASVTLYCNLGHAVNDTHDVRHNDDITLADVRKGESVC